MNDRIARMVSEALAAMNEAVRITDATGSSARGMEYVADWLNGRDAVDAFVAEGLSGGPFPPDKEARSVSTQHLCDRCGELCRPWQEPQTIGWLNVLTGEWVDR